MILGSTTTTTSSQEVWAARQRRRRRTRRHRTRRSSFHHDYDDYDDYGDYDSRSYVEYHKVLFRDFYKGPPVVRNPRDDRFFPGIMPAGVRALTPKLMNFITMHVNQVSYYIQGPPEEEGEEKELEDEDDEHFP